MLFRDSKVHTVIPAADETVPFSVIQLLNDSGTPGLTV
jgi:hypothetical protein